ncbi:MAG TPA: hypothetical protein VGI39_09515 [Polyangiaceae bacterium]|jgi:hypothetical protein
MRAPWWLLILGLAACPSKERPPPPEATDAASPASPAALSGAKALFREGMRGKKAGNRFAYIPPQCYTRTRDEAAGPVHNVCYPCHLASTPPNFTNDADLQLTYRFPPRAAQNPWRNLFEPAVARSPRRPTDDEVLAYVRAGNYLDDRGAIALAAKLAALPPEWDGEGDGHWNGFVPDAQFHFDDQGFDRHPDGTRTGWRAFAYAPFPGAFFPTNGSADDVLIRLDPALQEDAAGHSDLRIYTVNLAIVEALVTRADVPIEPVDEREFGVDLDRDGVRGFATRVAYDGDAQGATRMGYVGRAAHEKDFPIAPGLFPLGTEFLHSVRYLDVGPDGAVAMALRMKELRYAKKTRWFSYDDLRAQAAREPLERFESPDQAKDVLWELDRGVYNKQGWLFQGFIEDDAGALRPQTYEETVFCAGCHGGIGATTDSIFSFPRKLDASAPARGWFHGSQHDLRGLPEPRRDSEFEYTLYLRETGGGDDLRGNTEVESSFFDGDHRLRPNRLSALHANMAALLLPSPARALDLDRAYWAVVREQSFTRGRDAVLAPALRAYERAPRSEPTGVRAPIAGPSPIQSRAH